MSTSFIGIILLWIITMIMAFQQGYNAGYDDGTQDKNMGVGAHN